MRTFDFAKFVLLVAVGVFSLGESPLLAQLTITSPTAGGESVGAAPDYATEQLGNAWDMSDGLVDLANFIPVADYGTGLSNYNFNGATMGFTVLATDGAYFHLLSPGQSSTNPLGKNGQNIPIDSANYRYLHIRMYTDTASEARIHWNTGTSYADQFVRTATFPTRIGWHVYTIDLETVTREANSNETRSWGEAQQITGLRFEPGFSGVMFIDWVRLTTAATDTYRIGHSFTPAGNDTLYSLFLDDDTNPFNGYIDIVSQENTAATTVDLDPAPYQSDSYNVLGFASDDFATLTGNPWDMSESSDVLIQSGIANGNFANGVFTGSTEVGGSFLSMNLNGTPIDTSKYRFLSIGVTQTLGGNARIRWYDTSGNLLNTASFVAAAGSQVIQLDLASFGNWTGTLGELRYYVNNGAGETFSIDYISLRANGFVNALTAPTIVTAPGQLTVNDPPQLNIMQPDPQGGIDFAAAVLGDPWNMDSLNDIKQARHVDSAQIYPNNFINDKQGDFYCATSTAGSDDPYQVHLSETASSPNQIDTSRFKNITWEYYINRNQDVVNGSVTRIIFKNEQRKNEFLNGDDTMNQLGSEPTAWASFTQDMTKIRLEPLLHAGTEPNPIWDGLMNYLRVDIHEFSDAATDFCLNSVQVRSDDEANSQFAITYDVADSDDDDSDLTVSFYYSEQETTLGGAPIVEGLSLANNSRVYLWDTSGIPDGTYWVYGVVSDGENTIRKLAHRISINHSRPQDTTVPVLSVSAPADGADVYDTFRIQGYAIDDYQVAIVEVHIDDTLMHVFEPSLFNKAARTAHPTFSDSSQAGFDETFSIAALALGSHDVEVKVYDTAGNLTTSTFTVNKQSGATPPTTDPEPENDTAITVPTSGDTNIKFNLRTSVKRSQLTFTVTNADRCDSLGFYASTSKSDLEAAYTSGTLLGEASGLTKRKLKVKLKKLRRFPEGAVHFGFVCDSSLHTVRSARVDRLKKKPLNNVDKWFAKAAKKMTKALRKAK